MRKKQLFFLLCLLTSLSNTFAQTTQDDSGMVSSQFDTTGFRPWAKDLRRAEIVAFGSFPFLYFFSNFGFDTYRWSNNGWDTRYAPWPITSAGSVGQTQSEKIIVLGVAAGASVLIALIDHGIMRYKRNRLERESRIEELSPIIVRTPLLSEESGSSTLESDSSISE